MLNEHLYSCGYICNKVLSHLAGKSFHASTLQRRHIWHHYYVRVTIEKRQAFELKFVFFTDYTINLQCSNMANR